MIGIVVIKLLFGVLTTIIGGQDDHIHKQLLQISHSYSKTIAELYIDSTYMLTPLHSFLLKLLGTILTLFSEDLTKAVLILKMVSISAECLFMLLPLALLINTVHSNMSKTLRLSLFALIALSPHIWLQSVPHALFLGLFLFSLWFLLIEQLELSVITFALCFTLN